MAKSEDERLAEEWAAALGKTLMRLILMWMKS